MFLGLYDKESKTGDIQQKNSEIETAKFILLVCYRKFPVGLKKKNLNKRDLCIRSCRSGRLPFLLFGGHKEV
jgi:hypothetical protein